MCFNLLCQSLSVTWCVARKPTPFPNVSWIAASVGCACSLGPSRLHSSPTKSNNQCLIAHTRPGAIHESHLISLVTIPILSKGTVGDFSCEFLANIDQRSRPKSRLPLSASAGICAQPLNPSDRGRRGRVTCPHLQWGSLRAHGGSQPVCGPLAPTCAQLLQIIFPVCVLETRVQQ